MHIRPTTPALAANSFGHWLARRYALPELRTMLVRGSERRQRAEWGLDRSSWREAVTLAVAFLEGR